MRAWSTLSQARLPTLPRDDEALSLSRGGAMPSKFARRRATARSPVATVIESLLRGPMRISAPGDCNHALRQSSGAFAVQTGLLTVVGGPVATAQAAPEDMLQIWPCRANVDRYNTMKPSALIRRLEWRIGND